MLMIWTYVMLITFTEVDDDDPATEEAGSSTEFLSADTTTVVELLSFVSFVTLDPEVQDLFPIWESQQPISLAIFSMVCTLVCVR